MDNYLITYSFCNDYYCAYNSHRLHHSYHKHLKAKQNSSVHKSIFLKCQISVHMH